MAGEVFRFVGEISGVQYGSLCLPEADDLDTAYALNTHYDILKKSIRWARTERLLVEVAYPDNVELSEI